VRNLVTAIVIVLACVAGLWLASVDARTDDTGIEAGLIFLIAAALSAVRPRAAVLIALIVGTPSKRCGRAVFREASPRSASVLREHSSGLISGSL